MKIGARAAPGDPSTHQVARPSIRRVLASAWNAVTAAVGAVMGLLPHVLHHLGLLGGAVLVSGATGNVVFAVLGIIFSLPLLRRLHRRFGTWKAPALALAVFALMFSLSAFVVGPAISGDDPGPVPVQTPDPGEHDDHDDHDE
jgi:cytosine/uracil/thiamine/allantoin permease